jgi:hypothetical protein
MKSEDVLPHNNCNMSVLINWNTGQLSIPAYTQTKNYISLSKKKIFSSIQFFFLLQNADTTIHNQGNVSGVS